MIPVGENIGYLVAQYLVDTGYSWQWVFAGQATALALSVALCWLYGGRRYLDLSHVKSQVFVEQDERCARVGACKRHSHGSFSKTLNGECNDTCNGNINDENSCEFNGSVDGDCESLVLDDGASDESFTTPEVEYPVTEKWCVFWATNASLAAQLGFLSGTKYVIRDYGKSRGFTVHSAICTFSAIALIGPAVGGGIAMSGSVIRPDQWSQHKKTLLFMACTSAVASGLATLLPYVPSVIFWPSLFACFTAAGGVYPAAQGIINISLTATRVIDASVYQVQCNNILFAMPLPFAIGKSMDLWGVDSAFRSITLLQGLAASGFVFALVAAACTEERSAWHRLLPPTRQNSVAPSSSEESLIAKTLGQRRD
eukprot:CAMPEP_0179026360 /NCGR_PEP_ID=MMETSP0796-20121207/8473_1 /TAXON_ID=73915 /ORGANISM="Pyrodinium bahamense, Strain pbaha01" /LENGTH=368 /DNA_ID=CAMNT_0020722435 /DNA_START=551 /DNA_END=1657 /DNA_ORIENTATION=+